MVCVCASASARVCGQFLLPLGQCARSRRCAARVPPSAAVRCCSMRLHAALQVGMEPVDALEGSFRAAPALFQAGQLRGYLRGFLLQAFALLRAARPAAPATHRGPPRPARARPPAAPSLRASARSTGAWPRTRPCCARPATSTPAAAARCAASSPSICFSAAPRLAVSVSACAALRCALPAARSVLRWSCVSAAASVSACARLVSSLASRLSVSRNSRFSASGPSLAGLPPVTVALWKHSPSGRQEVRMRIAQTPAAAPSSGSSTR